MPGPYCYDYPRPAVTVDLAVFALDGDELKVLLIRRARDPFAGRWALPGGFLDVEEPIEAAARRELREETGLSPPGPVDFLGVYGEPGRDPRGRTISLAHSTVFRGTPPRVEGGDDAKEAAWRLVGADGPLAFDHDAILKHALSWFIAGLDSGPLAFALLPEFFDEGEVKAMHRAALGSSRGASSWLRRMLKERRIQIRDGSPRLYHAVGRH